MKQHRTISRMVLALVALGALALGAMQPAWGHRLVGHGTADNTHNRTHARGGFAVDQNPQPSCSSSTCGLFFDYLPSITVNLRRGGNVNIGPEWGSCKQPDRIGFRERTTITYVRWKTEIGSRASGVFIPQNVERCLAGTREAAGDGQDDTNGVQLRASVRW